MADAVHTCVAWIAEPATWADDSSKFAAKAGLEGRLIAIGGLPPGLLPSELVASATNFWRLDAGDGNGIFVAASDRVPVCNAVGGGASDFQPEAEALAEGMLTKGWRSKGRSTKGDMATSQFANATDGKLRLTISRAATAGARKDRVQFLATAAYQLGN